MNRPSSVGVGAGTRQAAQPGAIHLAQPKPQRDFSQLQQQGGEVRMSLAVFEKLVTIAKGSFGVVYKATRKDNGRVYALKQVEIASMNRAEREEAVDEVRTGCPSVPFWSPNAPTKTDAFYTEHLTSSFPLDADTTRLACSPTCTASTS